MNTARAHDPPDRDHEGASTIGVTVTMVRWPEQAGVRHALAAAGRPRLLVVATDAPPPLVSGDGEDWVRVDASATEIASRAARLAGAGRLQPDRAGRPVLDDDGVLHGAGGRLAVVPPIEAAILARLLDRADHVVHRDDLRRAAWPDGRRDRRAVDGRVAALRRRTAGLGVTIHTVRGVGYLLEVDRG